LLFFAGLGFEYVQTIDQHANAYTSRSILLILDAVQYVETLNIKE